MTPNLWDAMKTDLRGIFTAMQVQLRNKNISQVNNLTLHLKELEKEEQTKPKVSRKKGIIKIITETNKIESRKQYKT